MSSRVARGLESLARTARTVLSQVAVSVATALCVAFITGAYFDRAAEPPAAARQPSVITAAGIAPDDARSQAAAARAPALPPLQSEVIADLPDIPDAARELFPGVPAGMSSDALRRAVTPERQEPRRFFGLAIP
jgi:hypothetical protein